MKWLLAGIVFAGTFLLEFNLAQAAAPACAPDVIATCDQLAKAPLNVAGDKSLGFPASKTGAVVFNYTAYTKSFGDAGAKTRILAEMTTMTEPSPAQAANAVAIGKNLRDKAINILVGDTLPKFYSAEQKIALERLKALKFDIFDDAAKLCWRDVELGIPNAGYEPETHSINLCPATARQSPAYIAQALSHEIGHAVSPCLTKNFWLYKLQGQNDSENIEKARACDESFQFSENMDRNSSDAIRLHEILSAKATHTLGTDSGFHRELEGCGLIAADDATKLKTSDIFAGTQSCLEKINSSLYEKYTAGAIAATMQEFKLTTADAKRKIESENPPSCFGTTAEDFADSFGSKLFGAYASEKKMAAPDIRAALLFYRGTSCDEEGAGGNYRNPYAYSPAKQRLQMYFNNSDVASKLGCTPATEAGICPLNIQAPVGKPGTTKTQSSPAGSTKTRSAH
ncbi:MAG: hypothetical protein EOP05_09445 [Proteobacteria bacterium]|nr:MAG: hypothetical protein EOP05_09445 [Pseudomonadota bacterium]